MSGKKKKKKEKVQYIDDGSTVVDMSGVSGKSKNGGNKSPRKTDNNGKSAFQTYKESVKMMFIPMLVTLAAITLIFLILYIVLTIAELGL